MRRRWVLSLNSTERAVKLAAAFHVDELGRGHQDVGDGGIAEQRLQRPEAEDFVENFLNDPFFLSQTERGAFLIDEARNRNTDLGTGTFTSEGGERLQIDALQKLAVDAQISTPGIQRRSHRG